MTNVMSSLWSIDRRRAAQKGVEKQVGKDKLDLQGTVLNEVQHWTHDTPYMAIKDDPQFQALITNLAIKLICAKVAKLIEEELDSLDESQSVQLKQIASEVCKQIVCLKISDQFKESMMSIAEVVKQNITQKV